MIQNYLTYKDEQYASKWLVLIIDIVIVIVSFVLSYLIRFNLTLNFDVEKLFVQIPWISLMFLCSFLIIGSYKGVVRHAGVQDAYNLFNAICLASILIIFLVIVNKRYLIAESFTIPLSIIIINSLISFIALITSRFLFKTLFLNIFNQNRINASKNVLIYGAGESGILTYGTLTSHSKSNVCLLYTSPSPRDRTRSRMPSSA